MSYTVEKKYTIKETTKVIREKIVNDALAISTLDASEPTKETMDLVQEYIDGQKGIPVWEIDIRDSIQPDMARVILIHGETGEVMMDSYE